MEVHPLNDDWPEFQESRGRPEWARLLMWLTLTLGFLAVVSIYFYVQSQDDQAVSTPELGVGERSPLPPPEDSPIFEAVQDRAPLQFRENAAYAELLKRSREISIEELADKARTDVFFPDLLARPERYRGLPIRLQGTAILVKPIEDLPPMLSPSGRAFEAWVVTSDSQRFPYVVVFESAPEGLPAGTGIRAFVVFHGYFLKLLAYQAGDKPRVAPLLVGQVRYHPDLSSADDPPGGLGRWNTPGAWLPMAIVGLLAIYLIFRTTQRTRRLFAPSSSSRRSPQGVPNDQISPEDLSEWLNRGPKEKGSEGG